MKQISATVFVSKHQNRFYLLNLSEKQTQNQLAAADTKKVTQALDFTNRDSRTIGELVFDSWEVSFDVVGSGNLFIIAMVAQIWGGKCSFYLQRA